VLAVAGGVPEARHQRCDFYKWRSRFGGMEISDARKLKTLEEENRKLKKLLAESMLDASTLKDMLAKNF
jgi:putative transposase